MKKKKKKNGFFVMFPDFFSQDWAGLESSVELHIPNIGKQREFFLIFFLDE